ASIPKGTRDFLPSTMIKRNFIFRIIKDVFQLYGYMPIETPAMEKLSSLMGKYGEEGDRLLFRILNSGLAPTIKNKTLNEIAEKGLRYDLTVPFARFVVQHRNEINFPFKRYQIQPVWRGDRPQKGRYREFYQCDIDVIGSNALLNEIELLNIIHLVFEKLQIDITIKLNNRKILAGIAETVGQKDKLIDITIAIDKIEKIGLEKVCEELLMKNIPRESINELKPILLLQGDIETKLSFLEEFLQQSDVGQKGTEEIRYLFNFLTSVNSPLLEKLELDTSLARGLNYYTGAIIEVKANNTEIGSICGGGRYDDLTGIFGMPNTSGVGISFGADRIYDVMEELKLFPETLNTVVPVMFINFGEDESRKAFLLQQDLLKKNIPSFIFPSAAKLKKQFDYANKQEIPFVAIIGEREMKNNTVSVKNMTTGEQQEFKYDAFVNFFEQH
ncbi:MAG TPA: histidine--tRNA ligase, partial [Bacteroidales bacterium]|nr:histidine--tRNA ligase [Bacteroidales bacterium]